MFLNIYRNFCAPGIGLDIIYKQPLMLLEALNVCFFVIDLIERNKLVMPCWSLRLSSNHCIIVLYHVVSLSSYHCIMLYHCQAIIVKALFEVFASPTSI